MTKKAIILSLILASILATVYFYYQGHLVAYGDTESHLNISKRVIHSITPGLAQLGGIWLPLPHLLLVPFVYFDSLWRTGLAGAIVSGVLFVIGGYYLFKLTKLVVDSTLAGVIAVLVYITNPNILYLQSTAMTEIPLIAFFIISIYYFVEFLKDDSKVISLVFASIFGFFATLSRYDGWFLVGIQAAILGLFYLSRIIKKSYQDRDWNILNIYKQHEFKKMDAMIVLFCTLAFIGILGWFMWDYLILGDPLYFTNSPFSAKSQQKGWLSRGELPSYRNLGSAINYYLYTSYLNIGKVISVLSTIGVALFLLDRRLKNRIYILMLMLVPFVFYVITLYQGQSIIFVPGLTPETFEWQLFNVRYGVMMIPAAAFFTGYMAHTLTRDYNYVYRKYNVLGFSLVALLIISLFSQSILFMTGVESAITVDDGIYGLSSAETNNAQLWIKDHYDHGYVLMDDYARTISVIKSDLPMKKVIYVGNKPYWEESLETPQAHARWIVMQKDDSVWKSIYEDPQKQAELYKYFQKVYTSPEVLIFRINDNLAQIQ